ncbi:alpha carbonic anhydrase [Baffinella frigidus]|nr:alpha carbonic anhydrase [Cryptophyta sp. CCMP2293]
MLTRVLIALALVASATAQFPGARRATAGTGARRASAGEWNYDDADAANGPVHWEEICTNDAGAGQQSPVHLCGATKWGASAPTLAFTGYNEAHDFTLLNPSHRIGGVQIVAPAGVSLKADGLAQLVDRGSAVSGYTLVQRYVAGYTLVQAHFHWCAEHHIEGRQPPLEAHFVHMDSKFADLTEALGSGEKSALLVIGQFYEVFKHESDALHTIATGIDSMARRREGAAGESKSLQIDQLVDTTGGYYSYGGSLTTPTCNAVVTWVVMANALPITQKSLDMFLAIKQDGGDLTRIHGNARPLQAMGTRKVYSTANVNSAACPVTDNFCMEAGANYGKGVRCPDPGAHLHVHQVGPPRPGASPPTRTSSRRSPTRSTCSSRCRCTWARWSPSRYPQQVMSRPTVGP